MNILVWLYTPSSMVKNTGNYEAYRLYVLLYITYRIIAVKGQSQQELIKQLYTNILVCLNHIFLGKVFLLGDLSFGLDTESEFCCYI